MSDPDDAETNHEVGSAAEQVEQLLADRRFDGVVRAVQERNPSASAAQVQDAVLIVVARLVDKQHGPARNIEHLLVTAARRELTTQWRKTRLEQLHDPTDPHLQTADAEPTPEEQVLLDEAGKAGLRWLVAHMRTWDNRGHALVVELHLTAALDDIDLSPEEVAELVAVPLGKEVRPGTTATWKSRGLTRLRQELGDIVSIPYPDDPDQDPKQDFYEEQR